MSTCCAPDGAQIQKCVACLTYDGIAWIAAFWSAKTDATSSLEPVWKSKVHGTFVLNRRVSLHAIDGPDTLVDFHTA